MRPPPAVPAELSPIADLIGREALLRLIETHGGTRLFIPERPVEGSVLTGAVGLPAALALSSRMAGTYLKVPLARAWRAAILRHYGATNPQIARALGVTEGAIERMLRPAPRSAQAELFSP
ncbi:hypothetical protein VQH23_07500 [Pararoseomonas sp. SCSIO 73927]|uniref:hypothetical protein n=1 Tax=Pararoseomonas sp. SCSIO 73927 TaxID=3114537 RepID=UPI0030CD7843